MRALLRAMRADKFGDISAVIALYRPGPMASAPVYADRKTGRAPVTPIHPELDEPLDDILGESYGLLVYQEDVMFAAQKLAGYSAGSADLLRRAMGKKKKEILDKEYEPFAAGMTANGYSDGAIKTIWDVMVPFSGYAFNKAHAAGYALMSYWTAYLKANYPAEYMAGLLTSVARRQGQIGAVPERVPAHGHQGAAARRERVQADVHPGRHGHQVRHGGRAQRRHGGGRLHRGGAEAREPSPASPTSCARSRSTSATSG